MRFVRGETKADVNINITDAVYVLNYLFLAGLRPPCREAAHTDANGSVNITDAVFVLNLPFHAGPAIPPPNACEDREDADCEASPVCED